MPVALVCCVCEKVFFVPPVRAKSAETCSRKCRGILEAQKYRDARRTLVCQQCGKTFTIPDAWIRKGGGKYCSKSCANEGLIGNNNAPESPDGAITVHTDGYILERSRTHPFNVSGYVMQHRLVMEQWMRKEAPNHHFLVVVDGQKYLKRGIEVHHRNENRKDNRRKNLCACTNQAHHDLHHGKTPAAGSIWPRG